MKLNKRRAKRDEESRIQKEVKWCQKHRLNYGGFPYVTELCSADGVYLELFVPYETPQEQIESAIQSAYRSNDIVRHSVTLCPAEWLQI